MMDEKDIFNNNGDTKDNNLRRDDIYSRLDESSDMEDADEDLLALLDMISAQDEKQKSDISGVQNSVNTSRKDDTPAEVTNDIFSIDDFTLENEERQQEEIQHEESFQQEEAVDSFVAEQILEVDQKASPPKLKSPDNLGDIFSDALSAMDSLEDVNDELLGDVKAAPEKKLGFFQKLLSRFSKKDKKEEKNNSNKKASESKGKEEDKKQNKKESKNTKAEKAKNNAGKTAKAKPSKNTQDKKKTAEDSLTEEEKLKLAKKKEDKAKKAAVKAEKKKAADAKKSEKKKAAADKAAIKKQKKQEKKDLTPPDPDDNIKLNPLGVVFILTFFILIAGVIIVGTKTYSYGLDVRTASIEYSRGRYTEAYYSIYGISVKKQDYKTYDKIMTTMYVNKELNSYYNYMEVSKYSEALDSLLKGLDRYDIHIAHAKELGIEKNLKTIKKQMLKELKDTYGLTEKQADAINAIEDRAKYSVKVINIASEKEKEKEKELSKK